MGFERTPPEETATRTRRLTPLGHHDMYFWFYHMSVQNGSDILNIVSCWLSQQNLVYHVETKQTKVSSCNTEQLFHVWRLKMLVEVSLK